jgi:hypothetical protein
MIYYVEDIEEYIILFEKTYYHNNTSFHTTLNNLHQPISVKYKSVLEFWSNSNSVALSLQAKYTDRHLLKKFSANFCG